MSWDFFSTKSDSVTVVRERTRTIRIEITETYRETVTRRIDSSSYIRPQLDTSPDYLLYLPERKRWQENYIFPEQNYLLPKSKPAKKKSDFEKFFDWLFD